MPRDAANAHAYRALIETGRWFGALPRPLRDALLDASVVRRLAPGERLFARGDPPGGIYCIVAGMLRIGAVDANGREALLTLIEPVNWFGEIAVFDGLPRTHDAYADGPATVLNVPQAALERALAAHPAYWRELALLVTHKLRLTFDLIEEISLLPAPVRLARRLLLMVEGYGESQGGSRRVLRVPQEQLAMMLAITRQTTNRILKDLESQGALRLRYGEIEVADAARLRDAAGIPR